MPISTPPTVNDPLRTIDEILDIAAAQRNAEPYTAPPSIDPIGFLGDQLLGSAKGLFGLTNKTRAKATAQEQANYPAAKDWRVRLSLAPGANYMYNSNDPGIMLPLRETNGVVFPYTPNINITYTAAYDQSSLVHSNYKVFQYSSSSVDSIGITCEFTCQDAFEARYLLATIHFFRSMTKMFYGQDSLPKNGTPPPLCYIFGLGSFQFDGQALAITGFNYTLPSDVDYIETTAPSVSGVVQQVAQGIGYVNGLRNLLPGLSKGGLPKIPNFSGLFNTTSASSSAGNTTWVPTKIQINITAIPIVSRNQVSNQFSLADYASGKLLQGSKNSSGGFW